MPLSNASTFTRQNSLTGGECKIWGADALPYARETGKRPYEPRAMLETGHNYERRMLTYGCDMCRRMEEQERRSERGKERGSSRYT